MDSTHGKQNKMDRSYHKLILRSLIAIAGVGTLIIVLFFSFQAKQKCGGL